MRGVTRGLRWHASVVPARQGRSGVVSSVFDAVLRTLTIVLMAGAGFYIGLSVWDAMAEVSSSLVGAGGGYVYDGVPLRDAAAVWAYQRFVRAQTYYPWLLKVNEEHAPLILGAGMGLAGGAIEYLRRWLYSDAVTLRQSMTYPALGCITGFMAVFTMVGVPKIGDLAGARSLAALGFFSGVFSESAFAWVGRIWADKFSGGQKGEGQAGADTKTDTPER